MSVWSEDSRSLLPFFFLTFRTSWNYFLESFHPDPGCYSGFALSRGFLFKRKTENVTEIS